MNHEIPVFFSTDDEYVPFLDVAIASLIENASKDYRYKLIILNTGLRPDNQAKIKLREQDGFAIEFFDISPYLTDVKSRFKNVYHFSIVTYYRLFIGSLFPQYDKIVYLDCDLVVLGDVAKLYHTDLHGNILGAVPDQFVSKTPEFRLYAEQAIGVDPDTYFNAGVLLISLEQFRQQQIEQKFVRLITAYDFDLLDPDQAYLNYLCFGKTHILPNSWNKSPTGQAYDGEKNIVHYNLYKKPWQYDDMEDGEYFWRYAGASPFYEQIREAGAAFGEKEKAKSDAAAKEILQHAIAIVRSDNTFSKTLDRR
ncbi:MAG: glycosyltransferase family 8 protein [Clostridia bacterium]|nr:glycosyltransferase family 8 protein [Clostridia bacterium]